MCTSPGVLRTSLPGSAQSRIGGRRMAAVQGNEPGKVQLGSPRGPEGVGPRGCAGCLNHPGFSEEPGLLAPCMMQESAISPGGGRPGSVAPPGIHCSSHPRGIPARLPSPQMLRAKPSAGFLRQMHPSPLLCMEPSTSSWLLVLKPALSALVFCLCCSVLWQLWTAVQHWVLQKYSYDDRVFCLIGSQMCWSSNSLAICLSILSSSISIYQAAAACRGTVHTYTHTEMQLPLGRNKPAVSAPCGTGQEVKENPSCQKQVGGMWWLAMTPG